MLAFPSDYLHATLNYRRPIPLYNNNDKSCVAQPGSTAALMHMIVISIELLRQLHAQRARISLSLLICSH